MGKHGGDRRSKDFQISDSETWSITKTAEMQNQYAEIKLRAERKAGGMLKEQIPHKGGKPSHDSTVTRDFGIDRKQSNRWQNIAFIPEETFEKKR